MSLGYYKNSASNISNKKSRACSAESVAWDTNMLYMLGVSNCKDPKNWNVDYAKKRVKGVSKNFSINSRQLKMIQNILDIVGAAFNGKIKWKEAAERLWNYVPQVISLLIDIVVYILKKNQRCKSYV